MHRLLRITANLDFSVDVTFDDGRTGRIDLADIVASSPVAAPFQDAQGFSVAARIIEDGEILHWDEQFELHADSLRYRAFPEELVRDYGATPTDQSAA